MKKYFKIIILNALFMSLLLIANLKTKAFDIEFDTSLGITYQSPDDISELTFAEYGNISKISDYLKTSTIYNDEYVRVYEVEKELNLSVYKFQNDLMFYYEGSSYSLSETYSYENSTTFESRAISTYESSYGLEWELETNFGTFSVGYNESNSQTTEIGYATSFTYSQSETTTHTFLVLEIGYYCFERRALFKIYLIQEYGDLYQVFSKNYIEEYFNERNTLFYYFASCFTSCVCCCFFLF